MKELMDKYLVLINELNKITSDKDRYKFLSRNDDKFMVQLDNDCSSIMLIDSDIQEYLQDKHDICIEWFDNYHGRNYWNIELFEFAWIKAEAC